MYFDGVGSYLWELVVRDFFQSAFLVNTVEWVTPGTQEPSWALGNHHIRVELLYTLASDFIIEVEEATGGKHSHCPLSAVGIGRHRFHSGELNPAIRTVLNMPRVWSCLPASGCCRPVWCASGVSGGVELLQNPGVNSSSPCV